MTIARILLSTAILTVTAASHAQTGTNPINTGTSGPITMPIETQPPDGVVANSTQAVLANNGTFANNTPYPRYFANLYEISSTGRRGDSVTWVGTADSLAARLAGHQVFKSTTVIPPASVELGSKQTARAEVVNKWSYEIGGVHWYAISVFIPKEWNSNKEDMIFGQLHAKKPDGIIFSPPMALLVNDKYLSMTLQTSELPVVVSATPHVDKDTSSTQRIRLARADQDSARNKWYCFIIRADWSYTPGAGAFKVWMNGALKYEAAHAANAYNSQNYVKTGLYVTSTYGLQPDAVYTFYNDYIYTAVDAPNPPNPPYMTAAQQQDTTLAALQQVTPCGRTN